MIFDISILDTRFDWAEEVCKSLGAKVVEELSTISKDQTGFFISAYPENLSEVARIAPNLILIGLYHRSEEAKILDEAGAWCLTDEKEELRLFLTTDKQKVSISLVILAYNEEGAIQKTIQDSDRFCRTYFQDYEIIVVDDGSQDQTRRKIEEVRNPKVRLIAHEKNLGMGGAMRSGYLATSKDFIAPLPGDRQVRAYSLINFVSQMSKETTVVSTYRGLPSGKSRGILSIVFRWIVKVFGGLEINFAGSYLFHRDRLKVIDPKSIRYQSYVFSFEVLKRLKRAGSSFGYVQIRPFPRVTGASTEYQFRRMTYVIKELLTVRLGLR